ncbi:MAG: DUF4233 domain-containing protein [Lacisediminihabitans sp.]
METLSEPAQVPVAPRVRRQRSATESLLSIALGLEAVLMFFVALAIFRFDLLPAAVAFGGGAVVVVLLLAVGRMLHFRASLWFGWVLQAGLIALGFLLPLMFFIGACFVAIWVYCFVTGVRLDRRNAALRAEPSTITTPTHAEEQK